LAVGDATAPGKGERPLNRPEGRDAHLRTVEVYEQRAVEWERRRPPRTAEADDFTASLGTGAPPGTVVDLGCGPGWHLPHLPPGTVAVDAASAMLERVAINAPGRPRLRADLRALPFRVTSLGAVWANKSYVHLRRSEVPLALWDLHRSMAVGASAFLGLFGGDLEHGEVSGDPFAGRSFSGWPRDLLEAVLEGAGFGVDLVTVSDEGDVDHLGVWVRRERTLADTVAAGMKMLLVGLNPSLVAADAGVGFFRPGNRAWPALLRSGLATRDRDPYDLLVRHRIGMTDLVKRASPRADELSSGDYSHGVARLERLCGWLQPEVVCVLGLTGWRRSVDPRATAGPQARRLGGRPVYLMPNPSGANAHVGVDDLVDHLRSALLEAERPPVPAD
jgi:double-stranded uracil-DNA glycosylase